MYLITNRHLCSEDRYYQVIKEASDCGVKYIILREKDLSNDELEKLYYKVKNIVNTDSKIIINNNLTVCEKVNADGIHLSFDSYINNYDSGILPNDKLIGVSTHSLEEVIEVNKRKANYVFFSHIYETKCKEDLEPKGLEKLKEVKSILDSSTLCLVALGGITPSNVSDTLRYCDDIAVMSTIMSSKDVRNTIKEYR